MAQILHRSANILGMPADDEGIVEIARRGGVRPGSANGCSKGRDYAQVKADGKITKQVADEGLQLLDVDKAGPDLG